MSSHFIKAGALALACASVASATQSYTIDDTYQGSNFFNQFDFFTVRCVRSSKIV
jgi:hypothetical protein